MTLAVFVLVGAAAAYASTIGLIRPWGPSNYSASTRTVTITYTVSAGSGIPTSIKNAVTQALADWQTCLNGTNVTSYNSNFGVLQSDSTCDSFGSSGTRGWYFNLQQAGAGTSANIQISIKKGGGVIAGSTKLSFDSQGFISAARIQISGSSFGSANDTATVYEIAKHELGHGAIGLGHSNDSTDLMYPSLNGTLHVGACETSGFTVLYSWLINNQTPAINTLTSTTC